MRKTPLSVSLLCLLVATWSHAISRVGGGTVSNLEQGFEAKVPQDFPIHKSFGEAGLRLESFPFFGGAGSPSRVINIYELRNSLPDLESADRRATAAFFMANGWTPASLNDACIESYENENSSTLTVALAWGSGKGVVFTGPKSESVKAGIRALRETLVLLPGACSWK